MGEDAADREFAAFEALEVPFAHVQVGGDACAAAACAFSEGCDGRHDVRTLCRAFRPCQDASALDAGLFVRQAVRKMSDLYLELRSRIPVVAAKTQIGSARIEEAQKRVGLSNESIARRVPVSEKTWRRWKQSGEIPTASLPSVATLSRSCATRGFRLKSLNQELQIVQLLAKLPEWRERSFTNDEEAAASADKEAEGADEMPFRLGYLASARKSTNRVFEVRVVCLTACHADLNSYPAPTENASQRSGGSRG